MRTFWRKREKYNWIPWADRLLIGAVTAAILLVLFPIALAGSVSALGEHRNEKSR